MSFCAVGGDGDLENANALRAVGQADGELALPRGARAMVPLPGLNSS